VLLAGFDLNFGLRKPIKQGQGLWTILRLVLLWTLQWDNDSKTFSVPTPFCFANWLPQFSH